MTVDRLDQSRRLTAAARSLDLWTFRGMTLWHPEHRPDGPGRPTQQRARLNSSMIHRGYLIDLRDPLTRAALPLLVAEALGVERVWVESFYNGEINAFCWNVNTFTGSDESLSGHIEQTDFWHTDPTEAYLLFLEDLVDQAASTTAATTPPAADPVAGDAGSDGAGTRTAMAGGVNSVDF